MIERASLGRTLLVMGAIACQGKPVQAPASAPPAAVASTSLPAVSRPPLPPVHPEPPASAAPPAPQRVPHEYHLVYDGSGRVFVRDRRPLLVTMTGVIDLTDGRVQFEREPGNFGVYEGDSLWFADRFSPMSACPQPSVMAELVGTRWVPRWNVNVHALQVSRWLPGSSLAAVVPRRLGPPWGYELLVLEKNRPAPRPERSGPDREQGCYTRLDRPTALEAFPSGEIFVFGHECPLVPEPWEGEVEGDGGEELEASDALVVESFARGAQRSTFASLPLRELTSTFGVSASDVWAAGSVSDTEWGIVHFDGSSWTLLPERFREEVHSLYVPAGEQGAMARRFFILGAELMEVSPGDLVAHALPPDCTPLSAQVERGELWLSCDVGRYDAALFTTDPKIDLARFPEDDPERPRVAWSELVRPPLDPARPPTTRCGPAPLPKPSRDQVHSGKAVHGKPAPAPNPLQQKQRGIPLEF